jgi:hypothetical protein
VTPLRLQPAAQQFAQRLGRLPLPARVVGRYASGGDQRGRRIQRLHHRPLFGRHPEATRAGLQLTGPTLRDQRGKHVADSRRGKFCRPRPSPQQHQCVVQFIGALGAGRASQRTASIAAASSCPNCAALSGSSQRRWNSTACVRRSSSGASSR